MAKMNNWETVGRPGYFGRKRDEIHAGYDAKYGKGNWRLVWEATNAQRRDFDPEEMLPDEPHFFEFNDSCIALYEESYFRYMKAHPEIVEIVVSYGECIDNAPTNVASGLDYRKQESFSTHIQDIAVRNCLTRLGTWFKGPEDKIMVIRSKDDNGYILNPGNVPFAWPNLIKDEKHTPWWAGAASTEAFWQAAKTLQMRPTQTSLL
jgi:hypothetical protein